MTARMPSHRSSPSEIWDDDFEFSQKNTDHNDERHESNETHGKKTSTFAVTAVHDDRRREERHASRHSTTRQTPSQATQASFASLGRSEPGPSLIPDPSKVFSAPSTSANRLDQFDPLRSWKEPSKPVKSSQSGVSNLEENWDDDFVDKTDSPAGRRRKHSKHQHLPSSLSAQDEAENWDAEFAVGEPESPTPKRIQNDASWQSSDEENDEELGFLDREQEDKTITAASRRAALESVPPVPPLPSIPPFDPSQPQPFSRSPTLSAFSIPVSGRESATYGSTAHLALRPTLSAGSSRLAMLPPSPPVHRERRRLRKKSRPPHFDGNIIELEDRTEFLPSQYYHHEQSIFPPTGLVALDVRPSTPPPAPAPRMVDPSLSTPTTSPTSRSPLLARIGSVKRWSVRRKRASTGPAEVMSGGGDNSFSSHDGEIHEPGSSIPSSSPPPAKSTGASRFFRGGVGGHDPPASKGPTGVTQELKKEKSNNRLSVRPGTGTSIAEKDAVERGTIVEEGLDAVVSEKTVTSRHMPTRRPSSMQIGRTTKTPFPRHVSVPISDYSDAIEVPSVPRSVSASHAGQDVGGKVDGGRGFMGSVRRISFGTGGTRRHKRTKSGGAEELGHSLPVPPIPDMPRLSDETSSSSHPTSPQVELSLSPPSPQRPLKSTPIPTYIQPSYSEQTPTRRSVEALFSMGHSKSASMTMNSSPIIGIKPSPRPVSPQSTSLGRAAMSVSAIGPGVTPPRRNSLGDLKIPTRITKAQDGLKKDLNRVKEFAAHVEEMKALRETYVNLVTELQSVLSSPSPSPSPQPPSRATSPSFFGISRPARPGPGRARSNTNPPSFRSNNQLHQQRQGLISAFHAIDTKYRLTWECADLLVELGSGSGVNDNEGMGGLTATSASAPALVGMSGRNTPRERAVTLAGNEGTPLFLAPRHDTIHFEDTLPSRANDRTDIATMQIPSLANQSSMLAWRASTGRNDLSVRQLHLLKEMLSSSDLAAKVGRGLDTTSVREEGYASYRRPHHWQWGQGMDSAVTLPSEHSEESISGRERDSSPTKVPATERRRTSKLRMKGLRDMLRLMKKDRSKPPMPANEHNTPEVESRSASRNTDSRCSTSLGSVDGEAGSSLGGCHHRQTQRPHSRQHALRPDTLSRLDVHTNSAGRRRSKTNAEPETLPTRYGNPTNYPYERRDINGSIAGSIRASLAPPHKSSPRRPSLASLFRLGQKNKVPSSHSETDPSVNSLNINNRVNRSVSDMQQTNGARHLEGGDGEEDWDRMDDAPEASVTMHTLAHAPTPGSQPVTDTLRVKVQIDPKGSRSSGTRTSRRPMTPKRLFSASQVSFFEPPSQPVVTEAPAKTQSSRLPNLKRDGGTAKIEAEPHHQSTYVQPRSLSPSKKEANINAAQLGPVRLTPSRVMSAPFQSLATGTHDILSRSVSDGVTGKLAMTPENIKPLLENAREVTTRLNNCVAEVKQLLAQS